MTTKGNDPAHPTPEFYNDRQLGVTPGLTIREYFAAIALQGLLAARYIDLADLPRRAVKMADELITELNKEKP